jgi:hypothetical protein
MPRISAAAKAGLIALLLSGFGTGAASADVDIYIDKSRQRMTVAVDGILRYTWKVSTHMILRLPDESSSMNPSEGLG